MRGWIAGGVAMLVALAASAAVAPQPAAPLPSYTKVQGVTGKLKSVGSDTMNNVVAEWFQLFKGYYPGVTTEVEGKGSGTAPPALIEGTTQFGHMSRAMKASEIDAFEKRHGFKPTKLRVAIDALAVFVHKDNPMESISLEQLQRAWSTAGPNMTWGDLGVSAPTYRNRYVSLYGRNSASGTYGYFKKAALGDLDFKPTVKEQGGTSGVVQAIGNDPYGMGYSGVGIATADVKKLDIALETGDEAYEPTEENALAGLYPLARFLYVYLNHDRNSSLDPLRREFVRVIYSREGQERVTKNGYFAVPPIVGRQDAASVGIEIE
ncbi:MAG: phosphate ABC transporter substrate-binding protein [Planctomycetota bacterium]